MESLEKARGPSTCNSRSRPRIGCGPSSGRGAPNDKDKQGRQQSRHGHPPSKAYGQQFANTELPDGLKAQFRVIVSTCIRTELRQHWKYIGVAEIRFDYRPSPAGGKEKETENVLFVQISELVGSPLWLPSPHRRTGTRGPPPCPIHSRSRSHLRTNRPAGHSPSPAGQ